jgi:hypothetical protein
MTDDELHAAWIAGHSVTAIATRAETTPAALANRVRRLRRKEGLERWPYHGLPNKLRTRDPDPPKRLKRGSSTLPPLPSDDGTSPQR